MNDLIEALQIFAKYQKATRWPTICAHDVLYIAGVGFDEVSATDRFRLKEIGFDWSDSEEVWSSYRFGSA